MADYRFEKPPSAAVMAARARRDAKAVERDVQTEWFIENVSNVISMTMRKRVKLATELLKTRTVINISRPVTKAYSYSLHKTASASGRVSTKKVWKVEISDRSKPGEFPKADTTQLMKTIFGEVVETLPNVFDGYIGTPLDYGVILELQLHRSFLVRTFYENYDRVMQILSGPIA